MPFKLSTTVQEHQDQSEVLLTEIIVHLPVNYPEDFCCHDCNIKVNWKWQDLIFRIIYDISCAVLFLTSSVSGWSSITTLPFIRITNCWADNGFVIAI